MDRNTAHSHYDDSLRLSALRIEWANCLNFNLNTELVLHNCRDLLKSFLNVASARIWLVEGGILQQIHRAEEPVPPSSSTIPVGVTKIGRIAASRQPYFTNDLLHDPNAVNPEWCREHGLVAFAGVPLAVENQCLGVLAVYSQAPLQDHVITELQLLSQTLSQFIHRRRVQAALEESERRYRLVFDLHPEPLWVFDVETLRFLEVNQRAVEKYGYAREEFLAMTLLDIRPRHDHALLHQRIAELKSQSGVAASDRLWTHRLKNGQEIQVKIRSHTIQWGDRPARLVLAQDHTELLQSEARFRAIFDNCTDAILLADDQGRYMDANPAACELYAHAREEILGKKIGDFTPPELHELAQNKWDHFLAAGRDSGEFAFMPRPGRWIEAEYRAVANILPGVHVSILRDVTARRQAERELAEREARLRMILEQMPIGCLTCTLDLKITSWNPACEKIFGYPPADVLGRNAFELIVPDVSLAEAEVIRRQLLDSGGSMSYRLQNKTRHGQLIWCQWHTTTLRSPTGELIGFSAMAQDVTEVVQMTEALQENNRLFEFLSSSIDDVIMMHDAEVRFVYVSPSITRQAGYHPKELIGRELREFVHPEDLPVIIESYQANLQDQGTRFQWRFRLKSGHHIWVETNSRPVLDEQKRLKNIIYTCRDISQRRAMEEQLRQSQKLEAIGQLAGGIAHDFNNLLTVVIGCTELLLLQSHATDLDRTMLQDILRAGERGANLTRQLLAFSRQQVVQLQPVAVNSVLEASCKLLRRLLREDIFLETRFEPSVGYIQADPSQVEQVLMNLILNARDAMPNGGVLTVRTSLVEVLSADPRRPEHAMSGAYVCLEVIDTGHGMSKEVLQRLCEPFFTTKPVGQGTGLGLATVHGIVTQARGFLHVTSEPGQGSCFSVFWPASIPTSSPVEPKPGTLNMKTPESLFILVVEDDPAVRVLSEMLLKQAGYQVELAENPEQALSLSQHWTAPPDLVLSDLVMPGMSGREMMEHLRQQHPNLKVIYFSGYTPDALARQNIEQHDMNFLSKPFTKIQLLTLIDRVLHDDADGSGS